MNYNKSYIILKFYFSIIYILNYNILSLIQQQIDDFDGISGSEVSDSGLTSEEEESRVSDVIFNF